MADAGQREQKKNRTETVCVTGAAGYIGSNLVKQLLQLGYVVHATFRNPGDTDKVQHLLSLAGAKENLRLFQADLCDKGSFDAAIAGCHVVFHAASPTRFDAEDPENEIKAAVEATLGALESCGKAGTVKRVVLTASASTLLFKEPRDETEYVDESSWSDLNFLRTQKPFRWDYAVSKTETELAAFEYGEAQALQVITIAPVIVVGPWLTRSIPGSVAVPTSSLTGQTLALQSLRDVESLSGSVTLVHVEDLCVAHVFLDELLLPPAATRAAPCACRWHSWRSTCASGIQVCTRGP